ncbi:MAG: NAD(P)-dependent alcohol dehydrogenase [Nocardioides sp.]|nr:NAD(P)-dependent alcohol dehydrogenase [Nocardioides sp.]
MTAAPDSKEIVMKALKLESWHSQPVLRDVPVPRPGPGEVLVQVGGAGACHSDLHLIHEFDEGALPWGPPFTLGHENAGWVHAMGPGVTGYEAGQPVAVVGAWGCGLCARCRAGLETYCDRPDLARVAGGGGGLGLDGGMAEYLLVPDQRHLVTLPEGLDPVHAAPLTDAGLTPYHAVRRSREKLVPGSTAVVIGVGGLGHLGVQILHATTAARVIAVESRDSARDLAERSGADLVLAPGPDLVAEVREATHGLGADVVLDFVGSDETLRTAVACARMLADITIVGLGGGTLPVSFFSVPYEVSVQSTYWGNRSELVEVLDLAARGLLHAEIVRFGLHEAVTALEQLAIGAVDGRAVVVPHTEYRR